MKYGLFKQYKGFTRIQKMFYTSKSRYHFIHQQLNKQGSDKILEKIPNARVKYKAHGSDPRNFRVNFNKVKTVLGFKPKYTVQDGIDELVDAIDNHVFDNIDENRNFHGNYEIDYKVSE